MAVLPLKSEPKCKLCRSERRAEIDALLERRSNREQDADGKNINQEFVLAMLRDWGIENPTPDNLKIHWGKHCEIVSEEEAKEVEEAIGDLSAEMLEILDGADDSVDGKLRAVFNLGFLRLRHRILRGQDTGISLDHMMKASAELTKRQDNETKRDLMAVLGGGIMAALAQPKQPRQIGGAEVIESPEVLELPVEAN